MGSGPKRPSMIERAEAQRRTVVVARAQEGGKMSLRAMRRAMNEAVAEVENLRRIYQTPAGSTRIALAPNSLSSVEGRKLPEALPSDTTVRFFLDQAREQYVDVQLDGNALRVRASGTIAGRLIVLPVVSNEIEIQQWKS